jgi:hypothetical protein
MFHAGAGPDDGIGHSMKSQIQISEFRYNITIFGHRMRMTWCPGSQTATGEICHQSGRMNLYQGIAKAERFI